MPRYLLKLPVYKQGDDLAEHISDAATAEQAFEMLAQRYEEAARRARRIAAIAHRCTLRVNTDKHLIYVFGRSRYLRAEANKPDGVVEIHPYAERK